VTVLVLQAGVLVSTYCSLFAKAALCRTQFMKHTFQVQRIWILDSKFSNHL